MTPNGHLGREVLPAPDRAYAGLVTYDAKDPDTSVPADRAAAPAGGRAERAGRAARRRRLRRLQRLRRAVRDADRRAAGGRRAQVHPLPHHRAVLADPAGAADRPQPPHGRHGRDHRDRHLGARLQLDPPEHRARPLAETLKLNGYSTAQFGKCHEVPGVGDQPDGPVRRLADRRRRVRALLRLHRRRGPPVLPGDLRGHRPGRARQDARRGLPLHGGHDRPGHRLGPAAEGADGRQAVLRVLRARARPTPRTTSRKEWADRYKGQFDAGLGRAARGDLRAAEGARRDPAGRRADRAATPRSRPGTTCPRS